MKWLSRVTNTEPIPTPKMADMIGRLIASSEPKAMKRITMAASRPMPSVAPIGAWTARATTAPLSSMRRPGTCTALAASISGWAALAGRSPAWASKVAVA